MPEFSGAIFFTVVGMKRMHPVDLFEAARSGVPAGAGARGDFPLPQLAGGSEFSQRLLMVENPAWRGVFDMTGFGGSPRED